MADALSGEVLPKFLIWGRMPLCCALILAQDHGVSGVCSGEGRRLALASSGFSTSSSRERGEGSPRIPAGSVWYSLGDPSDLGYQREVREARQLLPDHEAQTKRSCP